VDPLEEVAKLVAIGPSAGGLPAARRSHRIDPIESRSAVASTRDGGIELGIEGNIAVAGSR
jgi:hypothetical protein